MCAAAARSTLLDMRAAGSYLYLPTSVDGQAFLLRADGLKERKVGVTPSRADCGAKAKS